MPCSCSKNLSSFRFIIKQQWTIEEISIFSNSSQLEWRAGLSDIIVKGTLPARFGIIWFSGFRGKDLNVIFYQNMPNLYNRYKSAERKILKGTHPRTIPAMFSLIWFRGFRGEYLNVKAYDVRRTPSDGKSSHGLWPGELKKDL